MNTEIITRRSRTTRAEQAKIINNDHIIDIVEEELDMIQEEQEVLIDVTRLDKSRKKNYMTVYKKELPTAIDLSSVEPKNIYVNSSVYGGHTSKTLLMTMTNIKLLKTYFSE